MLDREIRTFADVGHLPDGDLPRSRIVVAKVGAYKDRRYGTFSITDADLDGWQRNLTDAFGGRAAIDFDHSPEKGQGTKAAGWITSLERRTGAQLKAEDPQRFGRLLDDAIYAASDVEWSKAGAESIRNREYAYISPTFHPNWTDEAGVKRGRTMLGAGLTNRPFLRRGMPVISLSADDFDAPAEAAPVPSDSRGRMKAIAEKLKLDADADEATILDAIDGLLEPRAGTVTLSAEELADLQRKANAGEAAAVTLAEQRFTTAWDRALTDPKGARVSPAQKDTFLALYEANPDLAIKTLDELQPIVRGVPAGDGRTTAVTAEDGVDAERLELHERAEAYAAAKGVDFVTALDAVQAGAVTA